MLFWYFFDYHKPKYLLKIIEILVATMKCHLILLMFILETSIQKAEDRIDLNGNLVIQKLETK